jgi:DNA invertase Pin-like site-specific DNA recombinase
MRIIAKALVYVHNSIITVLGHKTMKGEDLSDAIAYCRVSTTRQAKDSRSLESYLARFKAIGFPDEDVYWDVDSGANPDRRGYQLILALIRSGKKHRVFVPEFSRFSREPGSFEEVISDFEKAGATIQPLDGRAIAFESPDDRHFARTQIVNAAYERDKIIYRSRLGHKFLRAEGRPIRAAFGLRAEKGKLYHNLLPYGDTGLTYAEAAMSIANHFIECGNLRHTVLWLNQQFQHVEVEGDIPHHHQNLKRWLLSEQLRGHTEYFGGLRYQRAQ